MRVRTGARLGWVRGTVCARFRCSLRVCKLGENLFACAERRTAFHPFAPRKKLRARGKYARDARNADRLCAGGGPDWDGSGYSSRVFAVLCVCANWVKTCLRVRNDARIFTLSRVKKLRARGEYARDARVRIVCACGGLLGKLNCDEFAMGSSNG